VIVHTSNRQNLHNFQIPPWQHLIILIQHNLFYQTTTITVTKMLHPPRQRSKRKRRKRRSAPVSMSDNQLREYIRVLATYNAKLENMLDKMGTFVDRRDFRTELTRLRRKAKEMCKLILSGFDGWKGGGNAFVCR